MTDNTAYESLQPYCLCGRALERPSTQVTPCSWGEAVKCSCGKVVAASFWRKQEVMLLVSDGWAK